jgi:hypothetical protein
MLRRIVSPHRGHSFIGLHAKCKPANAEAPNGGTVFAGRAS